MIEPIVVGPGHAYRPVFILNRGVGETLSGVEDGELNPVLVQKIQPMICLGPVSATGPAAFLPERAQIAVHGEAGPEGIALVPFQILVGGPMNSRSSSSSSITWPSASMIR